MTFLTLQRPLYDGSSTSIYNLDKRYLWEYCYDQYHYHEDILDIENLLGESMVVIVVTNHRNIREYYGR